MLRGPLPSQLCLLSSLPKRHVGDKVRFLGCVLSYSTSKAALCLGHAYPQGTSVTVSVNVELVLRSADHELTRVGEWVNVVGYITSKPSSARLGPQNVDDLPLEVQALLLWPTGPLDVHMYEQSLEDRPVDRGT